MSESDLLRLDVADLLPRSPRKAPAAFKEKYKLLFKGRRT